jgi:hypothetical protein
VIPPAPSSLSRRFVINFLAIRYFEWVTREGFKPGKPHPVEASVIKGSQTHNFGKESRCEPSAVCAFILAVRSHVPLRYMRSARSGPSDNSLSWVIGKQTRAEHSSGRSKQGRSLWNVEL